MKKVPVEIFYNHFKKYLKLKPQIDAYKSTDKFITDKYIHRPGLALTGFYKYFYSDRVQVLGRTDVAYIDEVSKNGNMSNLIKLVEHQIPCIITSSSQKLNNNFLEICEKEKVPVFKSSLSTAELIKKLSAVLEDVYAQKTIIHGSLLDVYGTGILLMGRSGIGKSEIALDLVERGHRLVADDAVEIKKTADKVIMGKALEDFGHFMEIRGLGLINVKEMFGTRAIRVQKRVEVIVNLEDWNSEKQYERIGLEQEEVKILGVPIPRIKLPIYPGKNITVIAETIALDLHLKVYGYNAAQDMNKRLIKKMNNKKRLKDYLSNDFE